MSKTPYEVPLEPKFNIQYSDHHERERKERLHNIRKLVGFGKPIKAFYWDKDHINGKEEHIITDNGLIIIFNVRTQKLVTILIARPNQISRYWTLQGLDVPSQYNYLLELAKDHEEKGYNYL